MTHSNVNTTTCTSLLSFDKNVSLTLNGTDQNELLRRLNDQLALRYLPVMVYMFLLIFTGFFGNILVIIIYVRKQPKSSTHYFIINLAMLDLLTVVIGMPTEIADLRYPYMFDATAACKLLRTIESLSTMGSIITLMAVAIDRYNRICKFGKQMTGKKAKSICFIAIFVGIITCWPAAIVFGKKTVDLGIPGISAVDCSTDDSMRGTKYPLVYYGSLFLYFVICVIFFTVVYSKIILFIRKQRKRGIISESPHTKRTSKPKSSSGETSGETSFINTEKDEKTVNNINRGPREERLDSEHPQSNDIKSKRKINTSKTTMMLGIVTVVFVVSFLPFLTVMVIRNIVKNFEEILSPTAEVFYKFCLKSYFINNSVNPIIYSFLNANFREDVRKILRRFHVCPDRKPKR